MKAIEEIGECPHCNMNLVLYKTSNYKRMVKCEICGHVYPIPKRGKLHSSMLYCPRYKYPILIVHKNKDSKAYFWTDRPCFTCPEYDSCEPVKELIKEFTDLEVYGY